MPERYEILVSGAAKRQLATLPYSVYLRVKPLLTDLRDSPRPHGCKKLAGSKSKYRIRVGDYRVLYEILDSQRLIRVYRVKHRSEAY